MQDVAVLAAADSTKRFVIQGAPTGFGKSLVYVSQALLTDARACILTSTKALQSQLVGDFRESGLIEIRGLNSYECVEGGPTGRFGDMRREGFRADRGLPMMCDEAPCQSGAMCPRRGGGCLYYDAYAKAGNLASKLVVTNYAYWMSINRYGEGMGKFDLLILDEAHNAVDELGSFIGTDLRPMELETAMAGRMRLLSPGADQIDWKAWGGHWHTEVSTELDTLRAAIKESERTGTNRTGERLSFGALRRAKELRRLQHKLRAIADMQGEWIVDHTEDEHHRKMVKFDPVWPGEYAESTLFLGVPKVVMVSATVRPKTAQMLGVAPRDLDFREYPSTFDKRNRPIVFCPAGAMNMNSAAASARDWHTRIDQIADRRANTKGIIHTVSYKRSRDIYMASDHKERMLLHDSTNTREVLQRFKESAQPLILVSPVMTTGYDFPGDQARWQIVAKMPFPVTVDKIMKARAARDREYRDYVTMIALVQMAGRICRAEDDWGETIIIDSDFGWWWNKVGHKLAPKWFAETVRYELTLGPALKGCA